jgi:cytidyltransferase-like protein
MYHSWMNLADHKKPHVVCSGHFAPLHRGHLALLRAAAAMGNLTVIVNNDRQLKQKTGMVFMTEDERAEIVRSIVGVARAIVSVDTDPTVCNTLATIHSLLPIDIFANGGDVRCVEECREADLCDRLKIKMVFGVGGDHKLQSSSKLIARAKHA